ncbi:MAG: class II aldolase/adducin family protein [Alphaproteobacteria bacterium]
MATTPLRRIDPKSDPVWQARVDLAAVHRLANRFGFDDGIWNHFTLVVPGTTDRFLVKPHGLLMSEVTASNLIVSDFEGNILEGRGRIERTAYCIHSQFHRLYAHAACVLHAHPRYATALTMTKPGRLLMIHQDVLKYYGRVAYDDDFFGTGSTVEEGGRMAKVAGDKSILVSANHGLTTVGRTVAEAWYDFYYFERACKYQYDAMALGQELRIVPEQIAQFTKGQSEEHMADSAVLTLEAMKRDLDREEPDYKE